MCIYFIKINFIGNVSNYFNSYFESREVDQEGAAKIIGYQRK